MKRREKIARIIAPEDFEYAERWGLYAMRMALQHPWCSLEYTGRYLVGIQRAYVKADEIIALDGESSE